MLLTLIIQNYPAFAGICVRVPNVKTFGYGFYIGGYVGGLLSSHITNV